MNPTEIIDKSWIPVLSQLHQEPLKFLYEELLPNISYQPLKEDIFRVFEMPVNKIKVVILGQDPYPTPGDAIGLAFATRAERKLPASLRIIIQEIGESVYSFSREDFKPTYDDSDWKTLDHWRKQGVFLLNTALTVETGKAGSHIKYWEEFTKKVIQYISVQNPCLWLLWGAKVQKFIPYIKSCPFMVKGYNRTTIQDIPANNDYNYILTAPHPAAETYLDGKAGFYGSNHFVFVNKILKKNKLKSINW